MTANIDQDIRDIFGTDINKIEMHSYTVAGTTLDAGNKYQEGVSAIDGKRYRRYYTISDGWSDFEINDSYTIPEIDTLLESTLGYRGDWTDTMPVYYPNLMYTFRGQVYIPRTQHSSGLDPFTDTANWADITSVIGRTVHLQADLDEFIGEPHYFKINTLLGGSDIDLARYGEILLCRNYTTSEFGVGGITYIQEFIGVDGVLVRRKTTWNGSAYVWGGWSSAVAITTQTELDAFKPDNGFARVANLSSMQTAFGVDYISVIVRSFAVNATGTTAGDWAQEATNYAGLEYIRYFSTVGATWGAWTPKVSTSSINAVPYTGATADVNLGEHSIKLNHVEFNTSPVEPLIIGATYYDAAHKVLATALGDGVILQNGLEMYVRVVNKNGYNLNDGEVVYISGAHGNRPTATRAIATSEQASYVIGICTQNIDNNQEGFVTVFGTVNNFNTSTFTDGAKLYLSATTAGGLTMTRPVAPNHGVIVGIALNSTPNGSIFVNPNSGFELNELHDVNTSIEKTIPLDADYFLVWDTVTSYWKKVTKAYMNEVYVGDTAPTHNEVLWVDTTSINNLSFIATTGATITPNFAPVIAKYTSNYSGGNTVLVDFPTNTPKKDEPVQYLVIKNLKGSDVTFVIADGVDSYLGIDYTYFMMQTDSIVVPSGKRVELSYMYAMTSANTCDVSIMYKVQE
jgi:hypothetical protein